MSNVSNFLGTSLRDLRRSHGDSGSDLAAKIGRSPDTVYRWEKGEQTPTGADLARIAATYNATSRTLLAAAIGQARRELRKEE